MKSLKENTYYQILKLRVKLFKNKELLLISISGFNPDKYDHKKISPILDKINGKLDEIKKELEEKYQSLELTSENIEELQNISNTLLLFKKFDESLLPKVEGKIVELTAIKENATKNYDFKTASIAREEARQLQKYFNGHKHYLVD